MSPGLGVCALERLVVEEIGAFGTGGYGKSAQTSSVSQSIIEGVFHTAIEKKKDRYRARAASSKESTTEHRNGTENAGTKRGSGRLKRSLSSHSSWHAKDW